MEPEHLRAQGVQQVLLDSEPQSLLRFGDLGHRFAVAFGVELLPKAEDQRVERREIAPAQRHHVCILRHALEQRKVHRHPGGRQDVAAVARRVHVRGVPYPAVREARREADGLNFVQPLRLDLSEHGRRDHRAELRQKPGCVDVESACGAGPPGLGRHVLEARAAGQRAFRGIELVERGPKRILPKRGHETVADERVAQQPERQRDRLDRVALVLGRRLRRDLRAL